MFVALAQDGAKIDMTPEAVPSHARPRTCTRAHHGTSSQMKKSMRLLMAVPGASGTGGKQRGNSVRIPTKGECMGLSPVKVNL